MMEAEEQRRQVSELRVLLADAWSHASTPATGSVLRHAYELVLVAEQYIEPLDSPLGPEWYTPAYRAQLKDAES